MLTVLRRLAGVIPLLFIISLLVFGLLELVPGDAAVVLSSDSSSTTEQVEQLREDLGLNEPLITRYGTWAADALRGDFGDSLVSGQSVRSLIAKSLPATFSLALVAGAFAFFAALVAAFVAAVKPHGLLDRAITLMSSVALAVPPFVAALLLVWLFAGRVKWLPAIGYVPITEDPVLWAKHIIMPAVAVAFVPASELARQARAAVMDVVQADYVRTARSRGLSSAKVLLKHVGKNAAIPFVTVLGTTLGRIFSGVVTVEVVFALPGFGLLSYNAVLNRDVIMIQGVVMVSALIVMAANLAVDLSYLYFDPVSRR
ncbi:MAG: ABC transporter permease [Acidimicrobiia bacterium]